RGRGAWPRDRGPARRGVRENPAGSASCLRSRTRLRGRRGPRRRSPSRSAARARSVTSPRRANARDSSPRSSALRREGPCAAPAPRLAPCRGPGCVPRTRRRAAPALRESRGRARRSLRTPRRRPRAGPGSRTRLRAPPRAARAGAGRRATAGARWRFGGHRAACRRGPPSARSRLETPAAGSSRGRACPSSARITRWSGGKRWKRRSTRQSCSETGPRALVRYTPAVTSNATRRILEERLAAEIGRIEKNAPVRVGLLYPSPYSVGMSSLGYQRVYRLIQDARGLAAERVFLADGADSPGVPLTERPVTYEGRRELSDLPVLAVSMAYEIEIAGLIKMLDASGIPPLARERDARHPFILSGGPLTFSNPLPLAPFADAIVIGEGEELVIPALRIVTESSSRAAALDALARLPGLFVPSLHGDRLPPVAKADDALLPAHSAIRTPYTELSNMFLIEAERGCSRGCTYCVMRRSTNGGMRIVPKEVLLERIPPDARRVGLVGAAVSDHPKIVEIVRTLAERGAEVG